MSWIMKLWIVSSIFAALAGFSDGIECKFCKKEFTSSGKHRWRCKARVNTDSIDLEQRQVINSYHATRPFENNPDFIGENASIANTNNMVITKKVKIHCKNIMTRIDSPVIVKRNVRGYVD